METTFIDEVLEFTQEFKGFFFLCLGWKMNNDCFNYQGRGAGCFEAVLPAGRELDTHAVFGVHVGKERPRVLM